MLLNAKTIVGAVIGFILLSALTGSFYTINETERGILLRNGKLIDSVNPGLSFKTPFIESVEFISVQSLTTTYEKLSAYSKDQQPAELQVSVSWRIDPTKVTTVYSKYKNIDSVVDRLINRQIPTQVENVFGQYTAESAVRKRVNLISDLTKLVKDSVGDLIVIESVQIENIDFSKAYEDSIADRMRAEVQVKTRQQDLDKEKVNAEIKTTTAKAEADSKLLVAEAEAKAIRIKGNADADAIKAKAEALASNQNLIELTKAERWNGQLPTTMLPNSAVPFISK